MVVPAHRAVGGTGGDVLHVHGLMWLLALGLGRRAWPHAVRGGVLVVRNGVRHRERVPLASIERAAVVGLGAWEALQPA